MKYPETVPPRVIVPDGDPGQCVACDGTGWIPFASRGRREAMAISGDFSLRADDFLPCRQCNGTGRRLYGTLEIKTLRDALSAACLGLDRIASWREGEEVTGGFDEPCSAQEAREALERINEILGVKC